MALFKIGEKDRQGRHKRVEHQGPYLRASRTGGVSLRAQTRVAGVNATANTRHGLRLSTRLAKNSQVAVQDGRFVLRGRYGSDAAKFNLSKSGVTVSTRTPSGTVNWVRPGRSSFKLAGVQVRGQKAVWLQLTYLLITFVLGVLQLVVQVVARLFTLLVSGVGAVAGMLQLRRALAAEQALFAALEQEEEVRSQARGWLAQQGIDLSRQPRRDLLAALSYCLVDLGRGETAFIPSEHGVDVKSPATGAVIRSGLPANTDASYPAWVMTLASCVAEVLGGQLDESERIDALLAFDDACLAVGPKSLLQEAMIDRLAEIWGLQVVLDGE